jgi:phosphopantetheinyl transferase
MPLIEINRIGKNVRYGIWEIKETLNDLEHLYQDFLFHEKELQRIKDTNRKKESIAARLILKDLLGRDELAFHGVKKDENLKPHLIGYDSIHVNLSHAWPYAVAIVNTVNEAGIDIEKISERPFTIAKKFMTYHERNHASNDHELNTAYWCLKETLYKAFGKRKVAFKDHLHVEPFELQINNNLRGVIRFDGEEMVYDVHLRRFNDYLIACNY